MRNKKRNEQTNKWKYVNASSYFIECPTNHTDSFFLSYMCVYYTMCFLYLFANVRVTGELNKCLVSELVFYFLPRVLFLHKVTSTENFEIVAFSCPEFAFKFGSMLQ